MSERGDSRVHHKRSECRICRSTRLRMFLSLGEMPLANAFLRASGEFAAEPRFPLDVYYCEDCSLVQLLDVIDPEVLFRHYLYVTGTSETMAAHNRRYAETVTELLGLGAGDLVVEVASNDGSLLKEFKARGVRTLGVEPARNIAAQARAEGIETIERFFDSAAAGDIAREYGPAKVVIGNNVLAHVDELRDFVAGFARLLDNGGTAIFEVPHLLHLVERLEYDTIYHEHLCYFSISSLMRLFEACGLSIVRVDRLAVHGGSLRVYTRRAGGRPEHCSDTLDSSAKEREAGLTGMQRYEQFAAAVARNRRSLVALLESIRDQGETVAGYGAPAKGNTLLNYCGIGPDLLPYTVDRNPAKVGMYTPGMHIPVLPAATVAERQPDYVLILAWNMAEEIMRQQEDYRSKGGRFILPIPEPRVVSA